MESAACAHVLESTDGGNRRTYGSASKSVQSLVYSRAEEVNVFTFLCLVCFLDGIDIQLLPASFRGLEKDLGFTPSRLAFVSVCQGFTQIVSGPIWGCLSDHGASRKLLMAIGVACWGVLTLLLAFTDSLYLVAFLRMLNGIALGMLTPLSQSLVVDIAPPARRGYMFGLTTCAQTIGMGLSAVFTTSLATRTVWGLSGWRFVFIVVGSLSLLLAVIISACMFEQQRPSSFREVNLWNELESARNYWRIPTFRVVVAQGVFGCIPGAALSFITLYFQYVGFSSTIAGTLTMALTFAHAVGVLFGGMVGDTMAKFSPAHGRPFTAQVSVLSGIPIIYALTAGVARRTHAVNEYVILLVMLGVTSSWCHTGVNAPILAEIVESQHSGRVMAWFEAIQRSVGMLCGPTALAFLAEGVYGYQETAMSIAEMPVGLRHSNARALGTSIMWLTTAPWIVCFCFYSILHHTYPADSIAARRSMADQRLSLSANPCAVNADI